MRPLICPEVQPDWLPEEVELPEELPGLEEPLDGELGSDVLWACAPMTRHAALMTAILSSCFLINLPFIVTALLMQSTPSWRRNCQYDN